MLFAVECGKFSFYEIVQFGGISGGKISVGFDVNVVWIKFANKNYFL